MHIHASSMKPDKLADALRLIDQYMAQRMQEGFGPGVALALTDRQGLLGVRAYGHADVATGKPVTPDTLFQIGSISKAFTAAALMRECEAGRLDLSAPVTEYLDWFQVQSVFDEPITIHHLLSHTSGLVCMIDTVPCSRYAVWALRDTSTGFPPGAHFHYSNLGYRVLGYVLERLTTRPFGEALRSSVLEPLGLVDSVSTITHDIRGRMALGYASTHYDDRPALDSPSPFPTPWLEFDGGSGSVAVKPTDLAAFLRMLLNRGRGDDSQFLSHESVARMTQPVIESDFFGCASGYGLFVGQPEELGGHSVVLTGGEMIGYESAMIGDMTHGVGVVVFVNSFAVPWSEARFALNVLQATVRGDALPTLPPRKPCTAAVDNAAEYVGAYRSHHATFELAAEGGELAMRYRGQRVVLLPRYTDAFYVPHPDFELSILKFGREEGAVVEAFHGGDWYRNGRYAGPAGFDYPPDWDAFVGHYRTHSPWMSNFRFFVRQGRPFIQWFGSYEQPLTASDDGSFRVGAAPYSPERLRFDCLVDGAALRADLSGGHYYRVDTP